MADPAANRTSAQAGSTPIVAFVNIAAGSADAARKALEATGGFDVREIEAGTLAQDIRAAVKSGATRVLVAGGDGTVACAADALAGSDVELAILPGGTLNHFAKDHRIPTDLAEAAKAALSEETQQVDVGYVGDHLFLNTFSVGMYVGYVRTRDRLEKRLGYRLASIVAMLRTFLRMYTMSVDLEVDGKVMRYKTALVFVGVGERELKAPKLGARIEGGRPGLHVIIVQGRRRARLVALGMAAAARGVDHVAQNPELDSYIVDRCTINLRRRTAPVAVDGEIVHTAVPLELRLVPDAVKIAGAKCP